MCRSLSNREDANSLNAPILRLPAEIRNRIYELIFADTSVHISSTALSLQQATVTRCVCSAQISDASVVSKQSSADIIDREVDYDRRHRACRMSFVRLNRTSF